MRVVAVIADRCLLCVAVAVCGCCAADDVVCAVVVCCSLLLLWLICVVAVVSDVIVVCCRYCFGLSVFVLVFTDVGVVALLLLVVLRLCVGVVCCC